MKTASSQDLYSLVHQRMSKGCCSYMCISYVSAASALERLKKYWALKKNEQSEFLARIQSSEQHLPKNQQACRYSLDTYSLCYRAILLILGASPKKWFRVKRSPENPSVQLPSKPKKLSDVHVYCKLWLERFFNRTGDVMPFDNENTRSPMPTPAQVNLPVLETEREVYSQYVEFQTQQARKSLSDSMKKPKKMMKEEKLHRKEDKSEE